jgi:hypothetical protein
MGAVTFTKISKTIFGNKNITIGLLTMSNSYAAGGDTFDIKGLAGINNPEAVFINGSVGGYMLTPNAALTKILAYEAGADAGPLDEVTAATDLSAETALVFIIG